MQFVVLVDLLGSSDEDELCGRRVRTEDLYMSGEKQREDQKRKSACAHLEKFKKNIESYMVDLYRKL